MSMPGTLYRLRSCEELYREHQTVKAKIAELEPGLRSSASPKGFAENLSLFVRSLEAELPPHFAKEEEGLFPVLESVTGEGFPPVQVMKAEHKFLIDHFLGVRDAGAQLARKPANEEARAQAARFLRPLIDTLEQHIVKEDGVLFVMASEALGESHDRKILRAYEEIGARRIRWE